MIRRVLALLIESRRSEGPNRVQRLTSTKARISPLAATISTSPWLVLKFLARMFQPSISRKTAASASPALPRDDDDSRLSTSAIRALAGSMLQIKLPGASPAAA